MAFILKQSTASQDIVIGAFVDDTDFKTAETGLSIANTDIKLMKDGAASVNKNSGGGTHRINGFYSITLDATDTGTVGQLMISVDVSGALPVWLECQVIEETVYDLIYLPAATGDVKLQGVTHTSAVIPTVTTLTGHTAQTADHTTAIAGIPTTAEFEARTIVSASYFDPTTDAVANVTLVATTTTNTDMVGTDSALLASNYVDHTSTIADIPTVAEFNARTILSADYFDPTADAVANVTLVATTTTNTDMRGTDGVPGALVSGTSDSGTTTTMVDAARTEGDTDFFKGGLIVFTSGNILGQARLITGFNFTTNTVTFAPATTQAVATQDYEIHAHGDVDLVNTLTTLTGHTVQTADHTAGIADIPTVAEFDARTLVSASYFDPTTDAVANVTLVATTTTNTDMVGTDSALLASNYVDHTTTIADIPTVSEFNARTLLAASYFDPTADAVANVTLVATTTTNTDMVGTNNALLAGSYVDHTSTIADIPTVAEFNARTLVTADYFDPTTDAVANVTLVATTTTNTDMRGTDNAMKVSATGTADSGSTTTVVDTERTEADTDYWKGCWIRFTNGTLNGQTRLITAFNAGTDTLTFAPALTTAAATHTYDIIAAADIDLVNTVTTLTGHTVQTADHTAGIADIPTVAEFEARTIVSASYFDPATDAVANVTLVATTTTNTDVTALNDVAATDIVSSGAITTLAGAVVNVDLCDLTTTTTTAANLTTNNDKTGYALSTAGDQSIADLILPADNTAFSDIAFLFVAASDHVTPVTGATGTGVTRSIDGSAFGAGTGTLAEVANGIYQYDASAADMNGKIITFRFIGTGGTPGAPDDTFVTVVTSK